MTVTNRDPLADMVRRTPSDVSQATAIEQARAVAEVAAAVKVAQDFPRDMTRAEGEMQAACGRLALAQRAFYRVPNRGNGPSVHLARELARIWGNVQYGVWETRRDDDNGVSEIQAWAWDVQTNTRSSRSFVVPHQRMVKGERKPLVDLGDVYLNNQNVGARAVRECIFTVLPTWFTESAQEVCHNTLRNGDGVPLTQRIDNMVAAFRTQYGVTQAALEAKLGRKRGQWDAGDVAQMTITYQSLGRGEMKVDDEFDAAKPTVGDFTASATEPAPSEPDPTPDDDGTYAEQPGDFPAAQNRLAAMFAEFGRAGFTTDARSAEGRQARLDYCSNVIGRPVESSKDLLAGEVERVINALKADAADDGELPLDPA
jgi:hypothetical protein